MPDSARDEPPAAPDAGLHALFTSGLPQDWRTNAELRALATVDLEIEDAAPTLPPAAAPDVASAASLGGVAAPTSAAGSIDLPSGEPRGSGSGRYHSRLKLRTDASARRVAAAAPLAAPLAGAAPPASDRTRAQEARDAAELSLLVSLWKPVGAEKAEAEQRGGAR